jgi:membrane protein
VTQRQLPDFVGAFAPVLISSAAFWLLYGLLPNLRVEPVPALLGALAAAVLWEIAKLAFAVISFRLFSFGQIYGALGAIPVFLLWSWVSWVVVLLGARLAYAGQASRHPRHDVALSDPSARQLLSARLLAATANGPLSLDSLAGRVEAHPDAVEVLLALLVEATLVSKQQRGFQLAVEFDSITLAGVRRAVVPVLAARTRIEALIAGAERAAEHHLSTSLRAAIASEHDA